MGTRHPNRVGFSIVMMCIGLTTLVLLTALTVDVGYLYHQKARLQMVTDTAVVGALGSNDTTLTIAQQQAALNASIANTFNVNYGNAKDKPTFTTTFSTTTTSIYVGGQIDSVALQTTQNVSTTFWRMVGRSNVSILCRARAEKAYEPLGFVSLNDFAITGRGGRLDTYSSSAGNYNPTNLPNPQPSPAQTVRFHDGTMLIVSNGTIRFLANPYHIFGDTRSIQNTTLQNRCFVYGDTRSRASISPAPNNPRVTGLEVEGDRLLRRFLQPDIPTLPFGTGIGGYNKNNITVTGAITGAQRNNARNGDLNSAAAGSFLLRAGSTYLFNRCRATGNATRVVIQGSTTPAAPTRIFFTGTLGGGAGRDMVLQGGLTQQVSTENAGDLQILGTNINGSITVICRTWSGASTPTSANTYAQIFAPDISVIVEMDGTSGTQFLGSLLGWDVLLNSQAATEAIARTQSWVYDESLGGALGLTGDGLGARVHLTE